MNQNQIAEIKNQYTLYKGMDNFLEALKSKSAENSFVANMLNKIQKKARSFDVYIKNVTKKDISDAEKEKGWLALEKSLKEQTAATAEQNKEMMTFFAEMDESVAKTKEWTNFYQLYFSNMKLEKTAQVSEWHAESKELGKRMKELKEKNKDFSFTDWRHQINKIEEEIKANETKIKEHPDGKKLAMAIQAEKDVRMQGTTEDQVQKERKECEFQLKVIDDLLYGLKSNPDSIDNMVDQINQLEQSKVLRNNTEKQLKRLQQEYEKMYGKALERSKKDPVLKEFHERKNAYIAGATVAKNLLETLEGVESKYRNIALEEITDTQTKSRIEEKVSKFIDAYYGYYDGNYEEHTVNQLIEKIKKRQGELEKNAETELEGMEKYNYTKEAYNKLFKTPEMLAKLQEIKDVEALLDNMPDPSNDINLLKEDRKKSYTGKTLELINTAFEKDVLVRQSLLYTSGKLYTAKELVELLEKRQAEITEKYEKARMKSEILSGWGASLQDDLSRGEVKNLKNDWVKSKKKLQRCKDAKEEYEKIKFSTDQLKNKINPSASQEGIKTKAKMLWEQREMRKGNHLDSKEYTQMMEELEIVMGWGSPEIEARLNADDKKNTRPQTLEEALNRLETAADKYLKEKNSQIRIIPTALRRTRFGYANTIKGFIKESRNELKLSETLKEYVNETPQTASQKNIENRTSELNVPGANF